MFHLLAVFEPLELFVRTLDDFITHDCLHSLVYSCLESSYVDLFGSEKFKQSLLLLETVRNQITIRVSLVHTLAELLLVIGAALRDLHEYGLTERFSLANHIRSMLHVLLVSCTLLFAGLCSLDLNFLLFFFSTLVAVLILVCTWNLNQASALKVFQEGDDARVHMACRLRQHSLLRLVLLLSFLLSSCSTLCSLLRIRLSRSFFTTSFRLNLLLLILLFDAFTFLFQDLLFLLSELFS